MNTHLHASFAVGIAGAERVGLCSRRDALRWLGLASLGFAVRAYARSPREYEVKAAFLFNFTKFVEWPAAAFASPASPVVLGIVGEDPFGEALGTTIEGETAQGRSLQIRHYGADEAFKDCHLLFVSRSEVRQLEAILRRLEGRPILTVSELGDFTRRGGMIDLVIQEQNVRFEVNLATLEKAGLKASSKLLAVASAVRRAT